MTLNPALMKMIASAQGKYALALGLGPMLDEVLLLGLQRATKRELQSMVRRAIEEDHGILYVERTTSDAGSLVGMPTSE